MSPKKEEDPRVVFPSDLGKELLQVARDRGHPESKISPLLRALAQEWIDKGSYRRREEELQEISDRLGSVEDQLRTLTQALVDSPSVTTKEKRVPSTLDNLTRRLLDHLVAIADEDGVTPRVTTKEIASKIGRSGDQPTAKQVSERVKKLIAKGLVLIEEDSGGRGGRRYRIEKTE